MSTLSKNYVRLREAANLLPGHPSVASLRRWKRLGLLKTVRVGGRLFVLRDELERFLAAGADQPPNRERHPSNRAAAADAELRARGL